MTTQKWTIDPGHSQVQFKVKHLAIANVSGHFKTFSGSVESDNDAFDNALVKFKLDTQSIDTRNAERDEHLRSDLFLHAERYPAIEFSGRLTRAEDLYRLTGDLKILETTRPVLLEVEHTGTGMGRFNDTRAGFEISGKINRKDFGLNFHLANDAGNLVVGNDIKILCEIELLKQ